MGDRFTARGGRRGLALLLTPERVHAKNRRTAFQDVFAGAYGTYAISRDNEVLVCGLNNYNQLGVTGGPNTFHTLVKSPSLTEVAKTNGGWVQIVPGQHHALALDKAGVAYALGRVEYGRLGLGEFHNLTLNHIFALN